LFRDLSVQYAMNNDTYPETIDGALDILDAYTAKIPRKPRSDRKPKPNTPDTPNDTNTDDQDGTNETSFAQLPKRCFCCGKTDHLSSTCSKKKTTPRSEWYINQAVNMFESSSRNPSTSAPATSDGRSVRFAGVDTQTTNQTQTNQDQGQSHTNLTSFSSFQGPRAPNQD